MTASKDESVSARKNRWHQSTISSLLDGCSWQYFLTYELELDQGEKPYAVVGTAYHSAIELHELNRMENIETSLEEMKDVAIKYVNENIKEESLKTELVVNVEAALENWYLRGHREWLLQFTPVGIEPEFTIPLVDNVRPIGGYIDAVYFDSNSSTYFVVDHKTAKNFDRWRTGDGHRTQATMYSVALVLSPEFPDITELPEMVYMVSRTSKSNRGNFEATRVVRVQPTMEDVLLLGNRMRRAEEIVRTDAYTKNTDWPLCSAKWCPFFQGCQVDKTLDKEPALLRIEMRQQYNTPVSDIEGTGETQSIKSTTNNAEEVNK